VISIWRPADFCFEMKTGMKKPPDCSDGVTIFSREVIVPSALHAKLTLLER